MTHPREAPGAPEGPLPIDLILLENAADQSRRDRRRTRWTLAAAIVAHALILFVSWPRTEAAPDLPAAKPGKAFVIQQVRFRPPPPPKQQKKVPKKKVKRIPIPDPTPDDPEPIIEEEHHKIEFELDLPSVDSLSFEIPDAPATAGAGVGLEGVQHIGGSVTPPVKLHTPQPLYTEEARAARIQGTVVLQAIVDAEGKVHSVRILKGLPLGLSESAVDTIKTWLFEPGKKDGHPVPVYYNFTVNFSLQ